MPNYIVSQSYFFREKSRRYEAGDTVEDLPVAFYEKYRISHPGLLRPAPLNTQGHPTQIRSAEVAVPEPEPVVAEPEAVVPEVAVPEPEAAPAPVVSKAKNRKK